MRAPTAALAPVPWRLANTWLSKTSTTLTSSVVVVLCLCLDCIYILRVYILVNPIMILICLGCLV
jgi:hypothetical protein